MRTDEMPIIDMESLERRLAPAQFEIAKGIVGKGQNANRLRASKPKVNKHIVTRKEDGRRFYEPDAGEGETAYVWRMVAFLVSPDPRHHCMPVCASFDLPYDWNLPEEARWQMRGDLTKALDWVVEQIVDCIPKEQWYGVQRWGQAFGMIGTPRYNDEGAVIYR